MKFTPRAPREGINVSPTHPLREAATLLLGISLVLVAILLLVVFGVDLALRLLPVRTEVALFDSLPDFASDEGEPDSLRCAAAGELLGRLAAHWPESPYAFRLACIDGEEPNAAALPGGWILVTTALLDEAESENELALVLGHELGHFRQRDHLRRLGRAMVFAIVVSAALRTAGATTSAPSVAGALASRGFDRQQESAADRFGLELVARQYGHVAGSDRFFGRLAAPAGALGHWVSYLSTHPDSGDRATALRAWALESGWSWEGEERPFPGVSTPER